MLGARVSASFLARHRTHAGAAKDYGPSLSAGRHYARGRFVHLGTAQPGRVGGKHLPTLHFEPVVQLDLGRSRPQAEEGPPWGA